MKKQTKLPELPPLIEREDLTYPRFDSKDRLATDVGNGGSLTFYQTSRPTRRGSETAWCITTLGISHGRGGHAARRPRRHACGRPWRW